MKKMKVGILGGSFNPVHFGHLKIAEKAMRKFGLDHVLFIPCYHPPHKGTRGIVSAKHRLAMTELAVQEIKNFYTSPVEVERKGISYSIDTLKELKRYYRPGTRFYFIIGSDMFPQLSTWHKAGDLAKLCEFLVLTRKRAPIPSGEDVSFKGKWHPFRIRPVEVSATEIRKNVRAGKSIKKWVPEPVEKYILENKLYR